MALYIDPPWNCYKPSWVCWAACFFNAHHTAASADLCDSGWVQAAHCAALQGHAQWFEEAWHGLPVGNFTCLACSKRGSTKLWVYYRCDQYRKRFFPFFPLLSWISDKCRLNSVCYLVSESTVWETSGEVCMLLHSHCWLALLCWCHKDKCFSFLFCFGHVGSCTCSDKWTWPTPDKR